MRPGQVLTKGLVEIDDDARRRRRRAGWPRWSAAPRTACGSCRPVSPARTRCRCWPARRWWSPRSWRCGCGDLRSLADRPVGGADARRGARDPAARRRNARCAKWLALLVSLVVLAIAVVLAVGFDPGGDQYQFVEYHRWIPSFGTGYILGVDGIALALVVLTAVLVPLLIIAGWNDASDQIGLRRPLGAHLRRADAGRRGHGADLARLAGRAAVLRVLRGHAHPDVLPDRRVRRRAARPRRR